MRRLLMCSVAVAALLAGSAPALVVAEAATPVRTAAAADFNQCGYDVNGRGVHLRSGPATRYVSLGLLHRGDHVSVDRKQGGWYRVTVSDRSQAGIPAETVGWVSERYLKPSVCMQLD
ncbi:MULTISPECIES: SH3 domain-containing protein [unclassified Streptomyces]|uniref:SH3 domain-containing protein n=1 Tax=unclassified Streptomyces TaxID=2593676 RepID=UPI0035DD1909